MEFACDRCQKRFSTSYQPVTGRVYRIPCKCGNNIVLRFDLPRNTKPPPLPAKAAARMTPPPLPDRYLSMASGRARAESTTKTMTVGERPPASDATPLRTPVPTSPRLTSPVQQTLPRSAVAARARLDPTASPEVSGEYPYEPSTSVPFGVAFAQSRRRAFLAGCGAGASGAILLVGSLTLVAWPSGPRSDNREIPAPTVTLASRAEQASAPAASASATVGGARAAPDVPRRVKQAPRVVVVAPVLVEEVQASHPTPTAGDGEPAARARDEEGQDSAASDDGAEPKRLAKAEGGEASDGSGAHAQTTEEQATAPDEGAAAATGAPAQADASSGEPDRVALVPAVESVQTPASDGAPGVPADEDRGQ